MLYEGHIKLPWQICNHIFITYLCRFFRELDHGSLFEEIYFTLSNKDDRNGKLIKSILDEQQKQKQKFKTKELQGVEKVHLQRMVALEGFTENTEIIHYINLYYIILI